MAAAAENYETPATPNNKLEAGTNPAAATTSTTPPSSPLDSPPAIFESAPEQSDLLVSHPISPPGLQLETLQPAGDNCIKESTQASTLIPSLSAGDVIPGLSKPKSSLTVLSDCLAEDHPLPAQVSPAQSLEPVPAHPATTHLRESQAPLPISSQPSVIETSPIVAPASSAPASLTGTQASPALVDVSHHTVVVSQNTLSTSPRSSAPLLDEQDPGASPLRTDAPSPTSIVTGANGSHLSHITPPVKDLGPSHVTGRPLGSAAHTSPSSPRGSPSLSPLSSHRVLSPQADQSELVTSSVDGRQLPDQTASPPIGSHVQQPHRSERVNPAADSAPMDLDFEVVWAVPGSQGTNFTKDQHRYAVSVLKQLKKHRSAGPFIRPVDIVALNIPDYPTIVKHPMDLTTIETRLSKAGKPCFYHSVQQFVSDVQLVFANCYTYNGTPEKNQYSRMALDLSIQFETQMKKMPFDEPAPSFASTSRSPSLAKPVARPKSAMDCPLPSGAVTALKRHVDSPGLVNSPASTANGTLKRRSSSPQQSRKKASKTTSHSTPGNQTADPPALSPAPARRASSNVDPLTSGRTKRDVKEPDQLHDSGNDKTADGLKSKRKTSVVVPMISNAKAELKFCKDVLREVNKKVYEKFVWPFYQPVDVVKFGIPEYHKVIKKPMDLWTMKQKLERGEYETGAAFGDDFRLMLHNCFTFNPPGSPFFNLGKQTESLFEAKWAERPPDMIPAPPPSQPSNTQPPPAVADQLQALQQIQMQLDQLQEKLQTDGIGAGHAALQKASASRAAVQSKLTNISTSGVPSNAALLSVPKSSKTNGGSGKAKSNTTSGSTGRRKSAPSAAKKTLTAHEQLQERQQEHRQQLLQQQAHASPRSTAALTNPKGSADTEFFEKIDYEQKKELATQIQNAVEPMQSNAINLIRTSRPDLVAADGEEIELDIDALDDRTLYRLYQLVCLPPAPPKKKKKALVTNGSGKTKGAPKAGGPRKSATIVTSTTVPSIPQPPLSASALTAGAAEARAAATWPDSKSTVVRGTGNGTKAKAAKKPRASGEANSRALKRKGLDEGQEAARIKKLEEHLAQFDDTALGNGHAEQRTTGSASHPPPPGPVEYASSSSESDSDSDEDSD